MSDPYKTKKVNSNFYFSKREIRGRVVVVLQGAIDNRALNLIYPISRAFSKGTIIELIGTEEPCAMPGNQVDKIAYIAFVELENSGVLLVGDEIVCEGKMIGTIAGYDDTHMPNHQNTIIKMDERIPGKELGLKINDEIIIKGF
jgi:hypothetical protein